MYTYIETADECRVVIDRETRFYVAEFSGVPEEYLHDQTGNTILTRDWFDLRNGSLVARSIPSPQLGLLQTGAAHRETQSG